MVPARPQCEVGSDLSRHIWLVKNEAKCLNINISLLTILEFSVLVVGRQELPQYDAGCP